MDEQLIQLGLDIPFSVKMTKAFRSHGIDLSRHYLSEEELVKELWTSRSNT
jgi:energy-coupling factor transport system ATP-binding protein